MPPFEEFETRLAGGLIMRGRCWRAEQSGAKTPAICIPGLTRNAADFDGVATRIAATGRDVYAFSLRGRGASDRDPQWKNYTPIVYRDDILAALDQLSLDRAVYMGTSLGGIVTMLTAETNAARIAAAIINDVGPRLAPEGIARIAGYVAGDKPTLQTFDDCIAAIRAINDVAFPEADNAFWRAMAKRTFIENANGGWAFDYDPNIARALIELGPAPDLNAGWAALAATPILLVRGAISDLLSPEIVREMRDARPGFDYVEAANVGHAPMLDEPDAWAAIDAFLRKTP